MKGAVEMADAVSTVSPTYANEIKDPFFAHGLDGIIRRNEQKLCGILNGIDVDSYNPATDPYIFRNYSESDMSGKAVCKAELQKMLSLPVRADVPVVAIVSRLVSHKGLDLVKAVIEQFLSEDVQVVVLGKATPRMKTTSLISRGAIGKCVTVIAFNADLSRKIYAGSDIFLMPSKTEPCGLSQMIASRYGTVAVGARNGRAERQYQGRAAGQRLYLPRLQRARHAVRSARGGRGISAIKTFGAISSAARWKAISAGTIPRANT